MITSNTTNQDIVASIEAMRRQEEEAYLTNDYLYHEQVGRPTVNGPLAVGVECRSKMVQWSFQIIDFCKFSRETVSVAMNYLDRFLATEAGHSALLSKKVYQLAAMTCIYTAVKLFEPEAMDPALVSRLSRGMYTSEEVEQMESVILQALKWRVNPPTTMSFVRHYLSLLSEGSMGAEQTKAVLEVARFQSELAVCNYDMVTVKDSTIALACLANALDQVQCDKIVRNNFVERIERVAQIDTKSLHMNCVLNALSSNGDLTACGSPSSPRSVKQVHGSGAVHFSPRSVASRA